MMNRYVFALIFLTFFLIYTSVQAVDSYWQFQLGGVTPTKYATMMDTIATSKPSDSTIFVVQYNGSTAATLGFGGSNVTATKAWIQASIITPLGLLTTTNAATAVGTLCKTGADVAAGN